ncbi:hypothetical protein FA95DRAFT_1570975 [Auriscalpium vulgare]|uniref:Uncharacterized protein n=1 Tax=Auriscalpium vulgare TaxID=40419 RepID=A0ACB8S0S4_9AGAM|nr:hypothetical protein FA95DRAFT_1570975 [Auriscalpium vulgare]
MVVSDNQSYSLLAGKTCCVAFGTDLLRILRINNWHQVHSDASIQQSCLRATVSLILGPPLELLQRNHSQQFERRLLETSRRKLTEKAHQEGLLYYVASRQKASCHALTHGARRYRCLVSTATSVWLSTTGFFLGPGQSQIVTVVIKPPTDVDANMFPVFSGYIQVQSETEDTHVTYMGLAAALRDAQILDNSDAVFGTYFPNMHGETSAHNYSFSGYSYPVSQHRLTFGTPLLRIDLVEANVTLTPTLSHSSVEQNGSVLDRPIFLFPHGSPNTFAQVSVIGALLEYDYVVRHTASGSTLLVLGRQFANTSYWDQGSYRILVRALKITGDLTQEDDFESWLSPIIGYFLTT